MWGALGGVYPQDDGRILSSLEGTVVKKKLALFLVAGAALLMAGRHCAHVISGDEACPCMRFRRSKDDDEPMAA